MNIGEKILHGTVDTTGRVIKVVVEGVLFVLGVATALSAIDYFVFRTPFIEGIFEGPDRFHRLVDPLWNKIFPDNPVNIPSSSLSPASRSSANASGYPTPNTPEEDAGSGGGSGPSGPSEPSGPSTSPPPPPQQPPEGSAPTQQPPQSPQQVQGPPRWVITDFARDADGKIKVCAAQFVRDGMVEKTAEATGKKFEDIHLESSGGPSGGAVNVSVKEHNKVSGDKAYKKLPPESRAVTDSDAIDVKLECLGTDAQTPRPQKPNYWQRHFEVDRYYDAYGYGLGWVPGIGVNWGYGNNGTKITNNYYGSKPGRPGGGNRGVSAPAPSMGSHGGGGGRH